MNRNDFKICVDILGANPFFFLNFDENAQAHITMYNLLVDRWIGRSSFHNSKIILNNMES